MNVREVHWWKWISETIVLRDCHFRPKSAYLSLLKCLNVLWWVVQSDCASKSTMKEANGYDECCYQYGLWPWTMTYGLWLIHFNALVGYELRAQTCACLLGGASDRVVRQEGICLFKFLFLFKPQSPDFYPHWLLGKCIFKTLRTREM